MEFQLTESATTLEIVGLNAAAERVAELHLEVKPVTEADGAFEGLGRSLRIRVPGSDETTMDRVGLAPLQLAAPVGSAMETFLHDPFVAEQLAEHGVLGVDPSVVGSEVVDVSPADGSYSHGGSCSGWNLTCSSPEYNPNPRCCMTETNGYGYHAQSGICKSGSNWNRASRACFTPPSCTSGKTYASTSPAVGCDSAPVTVCPSGSAAYFNTANGANKWVCKVAASTPVCGNTLIGGAGCSVCSTTTFPKTQAWLTSYASGSDTCSYVSAPLPQINGVVDAGTMVSNQGHVDDYIEIYGTNFASDGNSVRVGGVACQIDGAQWGFESTTQINCLLGSTTMSGSRAVVVTTPGLVQSNSYTITVLL